MQFVSTLFKMLFVAALLLLVIHFAWHTTRVTSEVSWFTANETSLGSELPSKNPSGEPKTIVLNLKVNGDTDCYDV
jgi:hypothetical protein